MSNLEIVQRIDTVLKEKNLKRQAVYDYANIAHNTFPNWTKREDTKIPAQVLYQISEFLGVSLEWLLTGKEKDGVSHDDIWLLEKLHNMHPMNRNAAVTLINALYEQEKHFWDPSPENKD